MKKINKIKMMFNFIIILILFTIPLIYFISCLPDFCSDNTGWNEDNTPNSSIASNEQEFINLLNNYRSTQGKSNVTEDTPLTVAAQRHANDMSDRDYFDHTTMLCGWSPFDRAQSAETTANAEIIYMGSADAQDALDGWKGSPGHDAIMLGDYISVGIGEKNGYWVALFRE